MACVLLAACKKDNASPPADTDPIINSIQPKNPMVGSMVTVTGKGFGISAADVLICIGNQAMTAHSVINSEIRFTVPEGTIPGPLSISIRNKPANNSDPDGNIINPRR